MRLMKRLFLRLAVVAVLLAGGQGAAQGPAEQPTPGQRGKDVVWVPTHDGLVDMMLDIAGVAAGDYVIDLGAGDGRIVIAAAGRGIRAHGIEYNPDLVALAETRARDAGLAERATFEKADFFEADLSRATVITMFVGQTSTDRLKPRILALEPGTRIVSNTYLMRGWPPNRTVTRSGCIRWCTAHLWIVPVEVEGLWRLDGRDLKLNQRYQLLNGRLGSSRITDARLEGATISFTAGGVRYTGTVSGAAMTGTRDDGTAWSAMRGERSR